MTDKRPGKTQPAGEADTTQTLAYWMGRVDATISDLKGSIDGFMLKDDTRWREFEAWRSQVDDCLQKGEYTIEEHARRLSMLEQSEKAQGTNARFGSWDWFRDAYLERLVLVVLTVILYKLIEIIVQHWTMANLVQ